MSKSCQLDACREGSTCAHSAGILAVPELRRPAGCSGVALGGFLRFMRLMRCVHLDWGVAAAAEVGEDRTGIVGGGIEHDIGGGDVAMGDAARVHCIEPLGKLQCKVDYLGSGEAQAVGIIRSDAIPGCDKAAFEVRGCDKMIAACGWLAKGQRVVNGARCMSDEFHNCRVLHEAHRVCFSSCLVLELGRGSKRALNGNGLAVMGVCEQNAAKATLSELSLNSEGQVVNGDFLAKNCRVHGAPDAGERQWASWVQLCFFL